MDLVSQLGGIGASISISVGSLGFIFVIIFAAQLTGVIHRKEKEKHRKYQIH